MHPQTPQMKHTALIRRPYNSYLKWSEMNTVHHSSITSFAEKMWFKTLLAIATFVSCIAAATVRTLPCERSHRPYMLPDTEFCDKYFVCQDGTATEEFCDDGLVFDDDKEKCELPHAVQCGSRTKQQNPRSTLNCPRRNGMYPVPGSCDKFYHCTDGQESLIACPPGVIFEPLVGACVHADQTNRPNCSASQFLNFVCPSIGIGANPTVLRFGDHDRLAHPSSCRHFYMCLLTGMPRLGGCTYGLVFNPVSGRCDEPQNVRGCEKWYGEGDPIEEDGVSDDSVSPALSSRKINNSAVRPSAGTVSAKAESEQTVKSSPQPSRRLSRGANLLGLL
ncbi:Gasp [Daphnia magna]|uniref:Gasp n=1 Tax=Daphnia magna TaxID=35525 RepID=A0A0P5BXE6_9CRUS|nr:Gasp [Daphnia magna]